MFNPYQYFNHAQKYHMQNEDWQNRNFCYCQIAPTLFTLLSSTLSSCNTNMVIYTLCIKDIVLVYAYYKKNA